MTKAPNLYKRDITAEREERFRWQILFRYQRPPVRIAKCNPLSCGGTAPASSTCASRLRVHEKLALAAQAQGKSINALAQEVLQERVALVRPPSSRSLSGTECF